jgi:hypothetical protein
MLPELALSSIFLIVVVLFPGLIFRRFYYSGKFTKQFLKGEWSERIVTSIFWGIFSQLITLLFISYIPWVRTNFLNKETLEILENISKRNIQIEQDQTIFIFILLYIIFSNVIAGVLGWFLFELVCLLKIDVKISALQYSNQWHYIFEGKTTGAEGKVLLKWVDLTLNPTQEEGKNKMIQGILFDYSTNVSTGDLEYLYLKEAKRYSHSEAKFKEILSDVFVVPFGNVVDMNIRYKYKEKKDYTNVYRGIIITVILVSFLFYFSFPWLRANPGTPIWKILLSYLPLFLPLVGVLSIFTTIFSLSEMKKQEKWNALRGTLIMIFFSALGWWLASLLLL